MITGTTANWDENGTAAIDDPERDPYFKATIDFAGTTFDDITAAVEGLSGRTGYEETLTGFVPSGAISGDVDINCKTGSKFSYYNTSSDLYGSQRLHRETDIYTGFTIGGSDQYLQQHSGYTKSFQVNSAERRTAIQSIDKSSLLKRKSITLPLMKDVPSDYLIRAILAEVDISDGQINDNQTDFMCKFDNSTTSEQGHTPTILRASVSYTDGKWGSANGALTSAAGATVEYHGYVQDFSSGHIAYWFHDDVTISVALATGSKTTNSIHTKYHHADGDMKISLFKDSSETELESGAGSPASGWNHFAVCWNTETENKLHAYLNGDLIGSYDLGTDIPTGDSNMVVVTLWANSILDHLSLGKTFRTAKDIENMYSADSADDDETDIDEGFNTIQYVWIQERNAWNLIKELCQAEGATFFFDSAGKAHFENRYHRLNPPYNTSQKTIAYNADMMNVTEKEDIDQYINRTVVKANPMEEKAGTELWSAQDLITIPKPTVSGTTVTAAGTRVWWVWFDDPCVGVDTSFDYGSSGNDSYFLAAGHTNPFDRSTWHDCSGSVSLYGTAYAKGVRIMGSNVSVCGPAKQIGIETPVVVSLGSASDTTTEPTPLVSVWGNPIKASDAETGSSKYYFVSEDTDNIGSYGERTLEIDNPFITSLDYAQWMSQYMLHYYGDPHPTLEGVSIMGDPRLEVGDRVTITDAGGATGINDDFWVTDIDWNMTPLYTQNLGLTYADTSDFMVLNVGTINVHRPAW